MFPHSYRKFYVLLGMCFVLSLGVMSMLGEPSITGNVVAAPQGESQSLDWPSFLVGLGAGVAIAGLTAGVLLYEHHQ